MDACACHVVVVALLGRFSITLRCKGWEGAHEWCAGINDQRRQLIARQVKHSRGCMHANFRRARATIYRQLCRMLGGGATSPNQKAGQKTGRRELTEASPEVT